MRSGSEQKVDAALALDPLSLHYKVQFDPDEAVEFASREVMRYGPTLELVEGINELIPLKSYPKVNGRPNPNDGQPHHKIWVGREYSRVVYLEIIKAYMPDGFEYSRLGPKLKALGRRMSCDEAECLKSNADRFAYRFWWD